MKNKVFLLDPGHCEETPGKRSPVWDDGSQLLEWEFNRQIVQKICSLASKANIGFALLVKENSGVSLSNRVNRANRYAKMHPDVDCIYVSVHGNGFNNENANGIEVWTSPGQTKSDDIATIFYNEASKLGWKMRPDKSDGDVDKESKFYVLVNTSMPAILTENGFYTNKKECKKMMSQKYQWKLAKAHVDTFKKYIDEK